MPSENMVWADRSGTIGWQAAGIQPLRRNWSGLLPVPGDGRYEWDGYLPIAALPHEVNPARGFIATANNYLLPERLPDEGGRCTSPGPIRTARRASPKCSGSGRLFSVAEMTRLQNDDLSLPARALVPLLRDLSLAERPGCAGARAAARSGTSCSTRTRSPPASMRCGSAGCSPTTRERGAAGRARAPAARNLIATKRLIDWLHAPDGRFGEIRPQARDALLAASLDEAVAELTKRFGARHGRRGSTARSSSTTRYPPSAVRRRSTRRRGRS